MGLRTKFNLAMLLAFVVGFAAAGFVLQRMFVADAREQVLQNARIMMSAANAVRHFTSNQIVPLTVALETEQSRPVWERFGPPVPNAPPPAPPPAPKFIPASVPSFAAQTTFKDVQAEFPDYSYHEPALNPTNPEDRASDWEADLINDFRNDPARKELVGDRATPTGPSLSLSRPIQIRSADCLGCHSTPAAAPATMISLYGTANGFGWKLNEIIGAQVVSIPMAVPLGQAQQTFLVFMGILLAVFVLIIVILNILLHYTVIRPAVKLAAIANAVSLGEAGVEEYEKKGSDEISVLSAAFNRMRRSLDSAMKMLEG
jgi:protein-histidine pros-kinase